MAEFDVFICDRNFVNLQQRGGGFSRADCSRVLGTKTIRPSLGYVGGIAESV